MENKIKNQPDKIIQLQTKILLAKVIIKNWNQAAESEKQEIEKWWNANYKKHSSKAKENYGEFKETKNNKDDK